MRGSIVASPVLAAYDPEPDYFFHWYRDSAVVIDALRLLFEDGSAGPGALAQFSDFVRFSLSLQHLDGRALVAASALAQRRSHRISQNSCAPTRSSRPFTARPSPPKRA